MNNLLQISEYQIYYTKQNTQQTILKQELELSAKTATIQKQLSKYDISLKALSMNDM